MTICSVVSRLLQTDRQTRQVKQAFSLGNHKDLRISNTSDRNTPQLYQVVINKAREEIIVQLLYNHCTIKVILIFRKQFHNIVSGSERTLNLYPTNVENWASS
jgi:hypothetical protein